MEKSKSNRVLLPAHLEQSNVFRALENALRLTDYEFVSAPDDHSLGVMIGEEVIRVGLTIEKAK